MRKEVINWEHAADDNAPCYFWNGDRTTLSDLPVVDRLLCNNDHCIQTVNGNNYEHCELVLPSDKEKYTEIVYEDRDNFIKALKEGVKMKVRVTPDLSEELQEVAFSCNYLWHCRITDTVNLSASYLFFNTHKQYALTYCVDEEGFDDSENLEYFPETDSFEKLEPKYRACNDIEEFLPFMGKIAKDKKYNRYIIITNVDFYGARYKSPLRWLEEYELLEPINGSNVIGIKED